jgi:hypothetical protein
MWYMWIISFQMHVTMHISYMWPPSHDIWQHFLFCLESGGYPEYKARFYLEELGELFCYAHEMHTKASFNDFSWHIRSHIDDKVIHLINKRRGESLHSKSWLVLDGVRSSYPKCSFPSITLHPTSFYVPNKFYVPNIIGSNK